ncbi:hypothetical protein BGZ63DRAFT_249922 [Mariannaea sp. PMI_226]|nr:hypothetical protein BGZ63DRAFT_249922 [Mariannaea sp. PMI_226]
MSPDRPFVCDTCAKIFTRNENLERHKLSKHQGEHLRPFECPRCQTRFSRKDVCKRHAERCRGQRGKTIRVQTPDSPFDDCAPSSIVRGLLQMTDAMPPGSIHGLNRSPSPNDAWSQSTLQALPSAFGELKRNAETYILAYRDYFHPSLPLLHQSSLSTQSPPLLLNIIVAIGCVYKASDLTGQEAVSCVELSRSLFDAGHDEIQSLTKSASRGLKKRPWAMQAWLLHIIYGAYVGDTTRYQKAKQLLRTLVDCVHDLGLLKQTATYPHPRPWLQALTYEEASHESLEATDLQSYWAMYMEEESMKLCVHTLMFLDFHILSPCNLRSQTSAVDFDWELPFSSALWDTSTPAEWLQLLLDDPRIRAHVEPDEILCLPCPSTKSLTLAAQSLMTDTPSIHLLSALEGSPITIIFLLTSIDALVRDMTRSLYQLPPTLADPSAFHILSQNQNRQIAAVLKHLSGLIREQPEDTTSYGSERPLWAAVERMCVAIKIALYRPDDLLIKGVVDSSVTDGLATATHLALGRYTGSRRSLQSLIQHSSGDDAMLPLLEETITILDSVLTNSRQDAMREPPWITVTSYRILLAIWHSMRWAAAEMRRRAELGTHARFDTPTVIFNSVIGVVSDRTGIGAYHDGVPVPGDETCFSQAILRFWIDRSVWAMGSSMVPILEEIISAGI